MDYNTIFDLIENDNTAAVYYFYQIGNSWYMQSASSYDWQEKPKQPGQYWYSPSLLSYGDYDDSTAMHRANYREFIKLYKDRKGVKTHSGAHGWECILLDLTCADQDIIETLCRLEEYPIISDEAVSAMEIEMEQEQWENCFKRDFMDALQKELQADDIDPDEEELWQLYQHLKEKTNTEFMVQSGGNGYINIKRLMEGIDSDTPHMDRLNLDYWC